MRDDVRELFHFLESNLEKKKKLLENILSNGEAILIKLKSGNTDSPDDLIAEDSHTINLINLIDFDIRKTAEEICSHFGKKYAELRTIAHEHQNETTCSRLFEEIAQLTALNAAARNEIVHLMEKEAAKVKKSADELKAIHAIRSVTDV